MSVEAELDPTLGARGIDARRGRHRDDQHDPSADSGGGTVSEGGSGGLNAASRLEDADFGSELVKAIERKVEYRRSYGASISNRELAVMD